ncbi:MAG: Crp/Fnr family transcriptional regulator [Nitrospirota bacterium]
MKQKSGPLLNCDTCTLRAQSVVCDFEGDELCAFQRIKHSFFYEPRRTVFYEGHACLGLYLLCTGKVKLTRSSARGQRQIVHILDAGQLIEKHAFRPGAVHEVTCETMEPSQICLIERDAYHALIQRNPRVAIKLIHLLSEEIGKTMDQLDEFTFKSARERLASLLLELVDRFGRTAERGVQVDLALKREEVAEMAGVTAETVCRLLSAFQNEGLVCLNGRSITVLKPDRLARIARL